MGLWTIETIRDSHKQFVKHILSLSLEDNLNEPLNQLINYIGYIGLGGDGSIEAFKKLFTMACHKNPTNVVFQTLSPALLSHINNRNCIKFLKQFIQETPELNSDSIDATSLVSGQESEEICLLAECEKGTNGDAMLALKIAETLGEAQKVTTVLNFGAQEEVPKRFLEQSTSQHRVVPCVFYDSLPNWYVSSNRAANLYVNVAMPSCNLTEHFGRHLAVLEYNCMSESSSAVPRVNTGIGEQQHGIFKINLEQQWDSDCADNSHFKNQSLREFAKNTNIYFAYEYGKLLAPYKATYLLLATHMTALDTMEPKKPTVIYSSIEDISHYLCELERHVVPLYPKTSFVVTFKGIDYVIPKDSDFKHKNHITVSNPFPLKKNTMLALMQVCKEQHHPIRVTGDQSLSEAISLEAPFFYQAVSWKAVLWREMHTLATTLGLNALAYCVDHSNNCLSGGKERSIKINTKQMQAFALWYRDNNEIIDLQFKVFNTLIADLGKSLPQVLQFAANPSKKTFVEAINSVFPDLKVSPQLLERARQGGDFQTAVVAVKDIQSNTEENFSATEGYAKQFDLAVIKGQQPSYLQNLKGIYQALKVKTSAKQVLLGICDALHQNKVQKAIELLIGNCKPELQSMGMNALLHLFHSQSKDWEKLKETCHQLNKLSTDLAKTKESIKTIDSRLFQANTQAIDAHIQLLVSAICRAEASFFQNILYAVNDFCSMMAKYLSFGQWKPDYEQLSKIQAQLSSSTPALFKTQLVEEKKCIVECINTMKEIEKLQENLSAAQIEAYPGASPQC